MREKTGIVRFILLQDWARERAVSPRRAREWAAEGRLPGARKIGRGYGGVWIIPDNAPLPRRFRPWDKKKGRDARAPEIPRILGAKEASHADGSEEV